MSLLLKFCRLVRSLHLYILYFGREGRIPDLNMEAVFCGADFGCAQGYDWGTTVCLCVHAQLSLSVVLRMSWFTSKALLKSWNFTPSGFTCHKIYCSNFGHLVFFLQNNSTYSKMCNTYWLCMLHNNFCVTWKFQACKHFFVEKYEWWK